MTPEQARAVAESVTKMWETEFEMTCKVIEAVKDETRDYKPDPKSRTGWELATHLAMADIWFLDSVIKGAFVWDQEGVTKAEAQFKTAADVAAFYRREFPARIAQVRALPGEKLAAPVSFFGIYDWPNAQYLSFAQNHSMHHRGQLSAYLRAMGSKVPPIYGASADFPAQAAGA